MVEAIQDLLVNKGREIFESKRGTVEFTGDGTVDSLINNLDDYPHAYVIACIMDRQIESTRAWRIPALLEKRLGTFQFGKLRSLSLPQIQQLMAFPDPLHRFPNDMGRYLHNAFGLIDSKYDGNAAKIWRDKPSSATVVYCFLQFDGVGPKIATMAANILARDFKVIFSDYYSIDISVDIHVRRVFERLGLAASDDSTESLIYIARSLSPEFPGLLDLPAWQIGRNWCRPRRPACQDCYMQSVCPSAQLAK